MAEKPWSVTTSLGAPNERALRAIRSSQDRRQCARFARVKGGESCIEAGEASGARKLSTRTVWLRTTLSQARRMPQRGQSFQRTGAEEALEALFASGGEASVREALGGHSTALTRRGLCVVLLS